jgi:hypothetical protein
LILVRFHQIVPEVAYPEWSLKRWLQFIKPYPGFIFKAAAVVMYVPFPLATGLVSRRHKMGLWEAVVAVVAIITIGRVFQVRMKKPETSQFTPETAELTEQLIRLEERVENLETIILEREKDQRFKNLS